MRVRCGVRIVSERLPSLDSAAKVRDCRKVIQSARERHALGNKLPIVSSMWWCAGASFCSLTVKYSGIFNMVMAGVFTSRKLANAVNEGFFFFLSKKPVYQHPTTFILFCPGH